MKGRVRRAALGLKNAIGWRSEKKYVALAVDDYGSIRSANARAVERLRQVVPGFGGQMDEFDAVETREDLEALYEVLKQHRDARGRSAVFTAYTLPANPDLDVMRRERFYAYELLTTTFERLAADDPGAYEGTWPLWQEGVDAGLLCPQFHGREHFNIPVLQALLDQDHADLDANLAVDSLSGLGGVPEVPNAGYTEAFVYPGDDGLRKQKVIIEDGLRLFEAIFGFRSLTFAPPGLKLDRRLDHFVTQQGVRAVDRPFYSRQPTVSGKTRRSIEFLRAPDSDRCGVIVRTLSFEPGSGLKSDPVGEALREVETAFRWNKPAIISSHRVNYAGHIDLKNRRSGLDRLAELLSRLRKYWPDIVFVSLPELVATMEAAPQRHAG